MSDYVQVVTTVANQADAQRLADLLVRQHLAACVQIIGPLTSVYQWEGEVRNSEEYLLQIKGQMHRYAEMERVLAENHPYEVPEILALPIVCGYAPYLRWIDREVGEKVTQ